ncbi:hypothetical protein ACFL5Z_18290 [Planctomycetota bacterium]
MTYLYLTTTASVWYTIYERHWKKPFVALLTEDGGRRIKNGNAEISTSFAGNPFAAHHGLVLPIYRANIIYVDDNANVANDGSSWTQI